MLPGNLLSHIYEFQLPVLICYNCLEASADGGGILVSITDALTKILPENQHSILEWDFLPWSFIQDRHADMAIEPLNALFEAYFKLPDFLDLEGIVGQELPEKSWGCMRCGHCCTSMRPGPVKSSTYRKWEEAGAPVALFYQPRTGSKRKTVFRCWYQNGILLRICPFMLINRNDSRPACSIYHMGDELRPPACSRYVPRHENCTNKRLEIDPWEIN